MYINYFFCNQHLNAHMSILKNFVQIEELTGEKYRALFFINGYFS